MADISHSGKNLAGLAFRSRIFRSNQLYAFVLTQVFLLDDVKDFGVAFHLCIFLYESDFYYLFFLFLLDRKANSREWDYARMRRLADEIGAIFMVDMAHPAGLIAAGLLENPVQNTVVVSATGNDLVSSADKFIGHDRSVFTHLCGIFLELRILKTRGAKRLLRALSR